MTTNERLAAIEANMFRFPTSFNDVRWLIVQVRRLTDENESACEKIKELGVMLENANTAIGTWKGEYARGREEIAEFCKDRASNLITMYGRLIHDPISKLRVEAAVEVYRYVISAIERGEHAEGRNGNDL